MKKIYAIAALAFMAVSAGAQNGAPLYVTGSGEFENGEWNPESPDRFIYADGTYTLKVDQLNQFIISTTSGDDGDGNVWENFLAGALTCRYGDEAGVAVPLEKGSSNILCPWKGDYTINVAGDLSTITLTTDTPRPEQKVNLYLRGDISGWGSQAEYLMTDLGDGRYTLHVENLAGEFKFADSVWMIQYGAGVIREITGNCTVPVVSDNRGCPDFRASGTFTSVDILLDTAAMTVTFSGLPKDQVVPEIDPDVVEFGYYVYNDDLKLQNIFQAQPSGVYQAQLVNALPSSKFYISSAMIDTALPEAAYEAAVTRHLYGTVGANRVIEDGSHFSLTTPVETLQQAQFSVKEQGNYLLTINPDDMTLKAVTVERAVYICGNVWSEGGVNNGFLSPSLNNQETYDREFRLIPSEGKDNVFEGCFKIDDDPMITPQFRFFTGLRGWSAECSLGASESDFSYKFVDLVDGRATTPIIDHGLGNWVIDAPGKWVNISVDLNAMQVHFELAGNTGIEQLSEEEAVGAARYFNLQGQEVMNPGNGLYIKVNGAKSEKVMR